jgi:hypothetical protein
MFSVATSWSLRQLFYTVKPVFHVPKGTTQDQCKFKQMKLYISSEINTLK